MEVQESTSTGPEGGEVTAVTAGSAEEVQETVLEVAETAEESMGLVSIAPPAHRVPSWGDCDQGSLQGPCLALDFIHQLEGGGESPSQVPPSCAAYETVGESGWPSDWKSLLDCVDDILSGEELPAKGAVGPSVNLGSPKAGGSGFREH